MTSAMVIAKVRRDLFALTISIYNVFQLMTQDTSHSAHFSRFKLTLYSNRNFEFSR